MDKAKKFNKIAIAALIVVLAGAGVVAYAYATTSVRKGAPPAVTFADQTASPAQSTWSEPVLGGLFEKHKREEAPAENKDIGVLDIKSPALAVEENDEVQETLLKISSESLVVFEGTLEEYKDFSFSQNGVYSAVLKISSPATQKKSKEELVYQFSFELKVEPKILFSSDRALQGDILAVYVNRGFGEEIPEIQTDLGTPIFLLVSEDEYIAYVPVNYAQNVGKWDIKVSLGDTKKTQSVIVTSRNYAVQNMTIPQGTVDATMNNPDGPKNWTERIKVLWDTYDEEKYWTETFLQPCFARISTEFGLFRYTNNNPNPSRHTGIDIAAEEDTPIQASNSGRIVRAEPIIYTGNTVVIEHGGGLKTYYYHMNALQVKEGDLVERGQIIGTVGSTGYSTGAHLHFEVKIGKSSLSPWELFDGTSELYFAAP
ncbi:MAG: M23 family metallopeptidase [Clostridia bacterium]|nr:M23 family metallopeptidase [Clostridia bacterium]